MTNNYEQTAEPDSYVLETLDLLEVRAAPQLEDPTDFGLDDLEFNKIWTNQFLGNSPIRKRDYSSLPFLVKTKPHGGSEIAVLTQDKTRTLYVMEFIVEHPSYFHGLPAATQVKVWKDKSWRNSKVTQKAFDSLLRKVPIVLSDTRQTELGKSFWEKIMIFYANLGYEVGLIDKQRGVILNVCRDSRYYPTWIKDHQWAWSRKPGHQRYQFYIRRDT